MPHEHQGSHIAWCFPNSSCSWLRHAWSQNELPGTGRWGRCLSKVIQLLFKSHQATVTGHYTCHTLAFSPPIVWKAPLCSLNYNSLAAFEAHQQVENNCVLSSPATSTFCATEHPGDVHDGSQLALVQVVTYTVDSWRETTPQLCFSSVRLSEYSETPPVTSSQYN